MTKYFTYVVALFVFAVPVLAQSSPALFPNITIQNFGQMDENLYRGAQPDPDDYAALKALGVRTVIDLRNDPTDYEKQSVESLGMRYVNIPMSGWKYAKDSQVDSFMKLMNDPETGTAFVHCKAGRHRTGLVGAVYRLEKYGWDYEKAYKEMKNFDYSSWPVHYNIKSYVQDYYKKNTERVSAARAAAEQNLTNRAVGARSGN